MGHHFTLKTDHKPLIGLQKKFDAIENQRLLAMVLATSEFSFDMEYLPGKKNILADYGTRQIPDTDWPIEADDPIELNNLLPFNSFLPQCACAKNKLKKFKQKAHGKGISASRVLEVLCIDIYIYKYNSQSYLTILDLFSNFPCCIQIADIESTAGEAPLGESRLL